MTTLAAELRLIETMPGVHPDTDSTPFDTQHYTFAKGIRFFNGRPRKIGGWNNLAFERGELLVGVSRAMFSAFLTNRAQSVIGTHRRLYSLIGQQLVNITPLLTTSTAAANSIDTLFGTLGSNPIATTSGSGVIVVTDTSASRFRVGDIYTLSGSTNVNGILAASINAPQVVRAVGVNSITLFTNGTATSTGSGGGASVVRASGILRINSTAHGQAEGDRVRISGAAAVAGIGAPLINAEHVIRNVLPNSFDISVAGTATSSVTGSGGPSTVYFKQIPEGFENESFGQGYGMGRYGVGLYGVSKTSSSGRRFPRIWFFDRFGDALIATPGNQTGVYQWAGSTTTAPTLIPNAPTAVNYAFVSNSILVTLGAGGVVNKILASDQNDFTNWTASSLNQVFEDDIEGAGRFMSHASVAGTNLLFTENQTYTFTYIGLPLVWSIGLLEHGIGIIAPNARVVVKGVCYWMGQRNFYRWHGGNVEVVPSNSKPQSTILNYVFRNLNYSQKSKIFAWYNKEYDEVWWHYPSANSNEPDRVARLSLQDMSWVMDEMPRTCAEAPNNIYTYPYLINSTLLYQHEVGSDNAGSPLEFTLKTNRRSYGKEVSLITGIIPDSLQTGTITLNYSGYQFANSTAKTYDQDFSIASNAEITAIQCAGRFYEYTWTGNALGQEWQLGKWSEYVQRSSPR